MIDYTTDSVLELARLERDALRKIRERMSSQQLGEAWVDLPQPQPETLRGLFS